MQKTSQTDTLNFASQTLPFLMITATFITIAYVYGHTASSPTLESAFDSSKINFNCLL